MTASEMGRSSVEAGPIVRSALVLGPGELTACFGRVPSLDGLRAVSILIVLCSHFISAKFFPGGLGVYIFFVISGFIIARLLLAEMKTTGTISLSNFYFRRLLRLYPVIVVFVLTSSAIFLLQKRPVSVLEITSALLYFSNYLYSYLEIHHLKPAMPTFEIFWSLSVEEHFYFLFPCFLLLIGRKPETIAASMILVCLICLALRLITAAAQPELLGSKAFYFQTQYRLDSIAYGVLIAAAFESSSMRKYALAVSRTSWVVGSLVLLLSALVIRQPYFRETLRYSFLGIAIAIAIVNVLVNPKLGAFQYALNSRFMIWIGALSYSLYLWHFFIASLGRSLFGISGNWESIVLEFAGSFLLAALSFYQLERPVVNLRHRFGSRTA